MSVHSRDEIRQDLGLDCLARCVGKRLAHQLHRPLGNPACCVRVPDDFSQRKGGNHRDRVSLEVVAELPPREDHCVEQLLDLRVARLGLGQDFADVGHRPLDRQGVPFLRSLYHDDGADHLSGCSDVEVQRLVVLRRC
jgi:hypothetical protein